MTLTNTKSAVSEEEDDKSLNPHEEYSFDKLLDIKRQVKALMMKPRKNWTRDDFRYLKSTNSGPLKAKLSKIKL